MMCAPNGLTARCGIRPRRRWPTAGRLRSGLRPPLRLPIRLETSTTGWTYTFDVSYFRGQVIAFTLFDVNVNWFRRRTFVGEKESAEPLNLEYLGHNRFYWDARPQSPPYSPLRGKSSRTYFWMAAVVTWQRSAASWMLLANFFARESSGNSFTSR
jgi:hypothetical protein